jgi:basic membrane protein A
MRLVSRRWMMLLVIVALIAAACGGDDDAEEATTSAAPAETTAAPAETTAAPAGGEVVRIAFVYDGEVDDGGWNQQHENGRQYLIENMTNVETTFVENVDPGSQFQAAFEDFGSQGYDMVVTTTYGNEDVMLVAPNYPDTKFISWAGWQTADNVGAYDAATEDGRYLDGLVAGSLSDVALIGYPGGFAIEEVVRGVNAFTIGAREMNPDVEVQVVWINSWYDPTVEQQAAQALVDAGVDLLAAEVNSPAVGSVAEENGIPYIHYGIDASERTPNVWLSSFTFNWGPYYLAQAEALAAGTWAPELVYGGLKDGMIGMAPFGAEVSAETIALVEQRRQEIIDGTFDYFKGPISDNQGNVVVPEGGTIPFEERTVCCQWLVEGIIGEVPG